MTGIVGVPRSPALGREARTRGHPRSINGCDRRERLRRSLHLHRGAANAGRSRGGGRVLEERIAEFDREIQVLGVDLAGTEALAVATEVRRGWLLVLGRGSCVAQRRPHHALRPRRPPARDRATPNDSWSGTACRCRLLAGDDAATLARGTCCTSRRRGLFALAFIHVAGAVYYASLAK